MGVKPQARPNTRVPTRPGCLSIGQMHRLCSTRVEYLSVTHGGEGQASSSESPPGTKPRSTPTPTESASEPLKHLSQKLAAFPASGPWSSLNSEPGFYLILAI